MRENFWGYLPRVLVGVAHWHDAWAVLLSLWLPQPGLKALPEGWRPVRSMPHVLVGMAH